MLAKWIFLPMALAGNCEENYTGRVSITVSGKKCQRWDRNWPHEPKYVPNPSNHNYCRNPDNDPKGPWCYTTNLRKRFEYCDIKPCTAGSECGITNTPPIFPDTQPSIVDKHGNKIHYGNTMLKFASKIWRFWFLRFNFEGGVDGIPIFPMTHQVIFIMIRLYQRCSRGFMEEVLP